VRVVTSSEINMSHKGSQRVNCYAKDNNYIPLVVTGRVEGLHKHEVFDLWFFSHQKNPACPMMIHTQLGFEYNFGFTKIFTFESHSVSTVNRI
jgi:hypothetical protein